MRTPSPRPSDRPDADGLRALVALLRLVLDARALGERAIAVGLDGRVMHEEVLRTLVGCDEAEALLVAEPLHGACRHLSSNCSTGPITPVQCGGKVTGSRGACAASA